MYKEEAERKATELTAGMMMKFCPWCRASCAGPKCIHFEESIVHDVSDLYEEEIGTVFRTMPPSCRIWR